MKHLLAIALVALIGCGPSPQERYAQEKATYELLREETRGIAKNSLSILETMAHETSTATPERMAELEKRHEQSEAAFKERSAQLGAQIKRMKEARAALPTE